jgi:hypothetical protein
MLIDFAVFVGGVFYVVKRLAAFLMSLFVILTAFAQVRQKNCMSNNLA